LNLDVAFLDQQIVDALIHDNEGETTALTFLSDKFPHKTNQDIRGELTAFGLSTPQQVSGTPVRFLSGGERRRLCLAACLLSDPQLLILDEPTSNLDVESVEALIYGLSKWNGTVVMASHDANFLRSLEAKCFVLMPEEGKLRRVV
jgi:ATPase subunit of ABC transporter with duplicated ATPase domains